MKVSIGIDIGANGAWAMFLNEKLVYDLIPYKSEEPDMKGLEKIIFSKINEAYNRSEVKEDQTCTHKKCLETKMCQENVSLGKDQDFDICKDGCVWFSPFQEVKTHCVIEDLHSIFGTSAKANFTFGVNNGLIIGMLQCSQIPYTKIGPKKWQKEMWQGIRPVEIPTGKFDKKGNPKVKINTKATSLIAVQRLFPKESFLATERSKKPHDGIVDSVLMAEYCRRNF